MFKNPLKVFRNLKDSILHLQTKIDVLENKQYELETLVTSSIDPLIRKFQQESLLTNLNKSVKIPPKQLQIRASGDYYPDFFNHGKIFLDEINELLSSVHKSIDKCNKILDFGCGCGRMLFPLAKLVDPSKIFGTDIDNDAIKWLLQKANIFGGLKTNSHNPPLDFKEATFDLIYSVSVFTHLPEKMQFEWLNELSRITVTGGYVILSIHGNNHIKKLPKELQGILKERGFYYPNSNIGTTEGLPRFYQTTYHTKEYVINKWSKYFEVIRYLENGIGKSHDVVLLKKK
jgi:SAM-dependent methyltransferase